MEVLTRRSLFFLVSEKHGSRVQASPVFLLMCLINFVHYYDSMTDLLQYIYTIIYTCIHIVSFFLSYMILHYMFEHICFIGCLPKDTAKVLSICQVS